MRQHFSDREIVEAILAIGFCMTMARLTEAIATDLDPAAGMTVFDATQDQSLEQVLYKWATVVFLEMEPTAQ